MSRSLQKTVSFCPAQLLPFLSCIRYTSFLLHQHNMYYTSYITEPLSSEICRHTSCSNRGGLGAPAQHSVFSPVQTTVRALPQVLHLKAFHIQLQLPYKYSLNKNIPFKGALHRAAAEQHHPGGRSSLQAVPRHCPLTPHSSALITGGPSSL